MFEGKDKKENINSKLNLGNLLTIAPIIGFTLALSQEFTFYYFLDLNPAHILDINDIIRLSAIAVPPTALIYLAVMVIYNYDFLSENISRQNSAINNALYYVVAGLIITYLAIYILLGVAPEQIAIWLPGLSVVLFLKFVAASGLVSSRRGAIFSMFGWLLFAIFVSSGASEAFRLRSGNIDEFPNYVPSKSDEFGDTDKLRLVRRFTEANLVVDYQAKLLVYISNRNGFRFVAPLDSEPFRGILCYVADFCWASGWVYENQKQD